MNNIAIKVEGISKKYRIGVVSSKTLKKDLIHFFKNFLKKDKTEHTVVENDRTLIDSSEYVWSLKDVNFEINKGDVVGIIGRNGAGKSTLLKILSRITAPTGGEIKLNGKVASLLEVGTGFHPELTGRENIYLNGSILGMSKSEITNKLDDIIEFAEVQRFIDTPVKRYSSGMYVRLAFSIAAHLEPDILIVDEVLAVGDAAFQKKCIHKMKEISEKNGRTILFVSHVMASIQSLCSKTILLDNGKVRFIGNVEEGINKYLESKEKTHFSSIEESKDRQGNGKVIFSDFYFENENGVRIDTILTGHALSLVFKLKKCVAGVVSEIDLGFSLHDNYDIGLSNVYSSYQKKIFDSNEEYFLVKFVLPEVNFSPGYLSVRGRVLVSGEESDYYNNVLGGILVEMGDFYKTGVIGQTNWGKYLIKGQWLKN